jgi:hypothetical protein
VRRDQVFNEVALQPELDLGYFLILQQLYGKQADGVLNSFGLVARERVAGAENRQFAEQPAVMMDTVSQPMKLRAGEVAGDCNGQLTCCVGCAGFPGGITRI